MTPPEPLIKSVVLACSQAKAFDVFTGQIGEWWPPERKHIKDADSVVCLTSTRFFERTVDGAREVPLGRVRVWAPPERIELDFYPGTDADHPTYVVVRFAIEGDGTRVTIEHAPTAASLELWDKRAPAYVRSWDVVLPALARHARIAQ